ncbi:MAG TPA: methylated-DNA--[protein]-cysteine S-methyltransferase [Candidatus Eisenbacteria bacterium]
MTRKISGTGHRKVVRPREARIDMATVRTRLGTFAVAATPRGLAALFPLPRGPVTSTRAGRDPALARRIRGGARLVIHRGRDSYPPALARAAAALHAYASGKVRAVRPVLDLDGTPFQRAVWKRLCAIPTGKTISYGALAASIGRPRAARAVGAAVGANPVPILVPCHRVIGQDGSLTGFGLGLPMKRALLLHEGNRTR